MHHSSSSAFDRKTETGSADLYFHYYGMLQHQQNMLQDYVRTATYYTAIMENKADFAGKVVMDVGAGTGILSLFAAQAGARKVYAIEASNMANYARTLAATNPELGARIEVLHVKVEDMAATVEQVDVLVSEPMGTLLVNERMLETYLYARDRFLKPGGLMFPRLGRIHAAAFSDEVLYAEMVNKAAFWVQQSYFGIDLTALYAPALSGYFAQVVVDAVDPQLLVSDCVTRTFDFDTIREEELHDIVIPLHLDIAYACNVHGLACWFDVLFGGTTAERWLSTAPGLQTTHWFQLRCVLQQPLAVQAGATVTGELRLVAHERQSYDIHVTLQAPGLQADAPAQAASGKLDLKEPIYRQLTSWYPPQGAEQGSDPEDGIGAPADVAPAYPDPSQFSDPEVPAGAAHQQPLGHLLTDVSTAFPGATATATTTATATATAAAASAAEPAGMTHVDSTSASMQINHIANQLEYGQHDAAHASKAAIHSELDV